MRNTKENLADGLRKVNVQEVTGGKMKISTEQKDGVLYVRLSGDADERSISQARKEADELADRFGGQLEKAVFDLQGVTSMNSTGIGFLLGRYKKFLHYGVATYVTNPSVAVDKILQTSGIYTLTPKI